MWSMTWPMKLSMGCWRVQIRLRPKPFARQSPCRVPETPADGALRIAHAPMRIGEALHQNVRRVHADADLRPSSSSQVRTSAFHSIHGASNQPAVKRRTRTAHGLM